MECKCSMCCNLEFEIPKELISAIEKEELVIFAGAGVSTESKGVFKTSLYTEIKEELNIDEEISFSQLMKIFCEKPNGRRNLIKRIKDRVDYCNAFQELERMFSPFFDNISNIYQIKNIITTNWDDFFERKCNCRPIIYDKDIALIDENERKVIKIHGSIENVSSMVITERDYKNCYKNLSKNLIGSKLKSLLATKTVVFIGYSLEDEDFLRIWNFLKVQLEELQPHFYVVSPDLNMKERLKKENVTIINAVANDFSEKLKHILERKKLILDKQNIIASAHALLDEILKQHKYTCESFEKDRNCLYSYCLYYQDGYIHSLERILGLQNSGIYYDIHYIMDSIKSYEYLTQEYYRQGNFFDGVYVKGYTNAMKTLLEVYKSKGKECNKCETNFYYLFNKVEMNKLEEFKKAIENFKLIDIERVAHKYFLENGLYDTPGIEPHHRPFL